MIRALEQFGVTIRVIPSPESIDFFVLNLGNVRAALEWTFLDLEDVSACLFFQAGLLPECRAWIESA